MKRVFCILFVLFIGLQVHAGELFQLSTSYVQPINGTVKSRGKTDYIVLKAKTRVVGKTLLEDDFFSSISKTVLHQETAYVPYYLEVDGETYIMIIDKNSKSWSKDDIFGIEDNINSLFTAIKNLESDNDYGKISANELKKAHIRFAKVKNGDTVLANDKSQDFDLNKIDYIDTRSLKKIANCENDGIIGHFKVYLKTNDNSKKIVVGYSSLDSLEKLNLLFTTI